MASWFTNGRRSIFESLAEVCDKIEDDLKAELDNSKNELELLKSRASEADKLAQENRELRARLQHLDRDRTTPETPQNIKALATGRALESSEPPLNNPRLRLPPTPQSAGLNTTSPSVQISDGKVDWKLEAAKNAAKYSRLQAELRTAIDTLAKRKEERDKWKQFAERLQKKIETLEARLGQQDPQKLDNPAPATSPRRGLVNAHLPTVKQNSSSSAEPMLPPAVDKGRVPPSTSPHAGGNDYFHDDSPTGSDTTEETREFPSPKLPDLPRGNSPGTHTEIKEEPSSDTPVVVSERAVKKRKRDEPEVDQPRVTRVKEEPTSQSDPIVAADVCDFSPATSVDLDESGTRFDTPRKNMGLDRFFTGHTPCPAPQVRPDNGVETHGTPRVPDQVSRPALQPLSTNVQTPRLQRPPRKGLAHAVGVLAEDGASYELSARDRIASPRTEQNTGRLTSLLTGVSKASESPIIRPFSRNPETPRSNLAPRPSTESRSSAVSVWLHAPQPRELPFDKINRDRSNATPKQTPSGTNGGPTPATASKKDSSGVASSEPKLRTRPVSVLKLDDFKINPNFNDGYDYAYSEVVRNKDERACLPGCTDMECCGKSFRAMALAERGNGRRTAEQLAEDKKLLEDYLGEEAHRLFSMTKEERDELWLEAKTKELANRIGKHRHRFSRMKTPPGFWRTDFPDTQELQEDRVQALRREKEMIQERHREAMRPGGKWVFRDE